MALAEHRELDGLTDEQVLDLATVQRRIIVTCNGRDLSPLLRAWADEGRPHAGCILVWSQPQHDFGGVLRAVRVALAAYPRPREWIDRTIALCGTVRGVG
jgi:hypothetical protein